MQQLLRLSPVYSKYRYFLISTRVENNRKANCNINRIYHITDINEGRGLRNPVRIFLALLQTIRIFWKEKPDLILSTGAGLSVPSFILAKILGIFSIYIESYARITSPSQSGRVCYLFASLFIIQHEQLRQFYKNSVFLGSVYENI